MDESTEDIQKIKERNVSSGSNSNIPNDNSFLNKLKNGYHPMTEGVRWSEKYSDKFDTIWSRTPKLVRSILATIAVFLLGSALQGEWILIVVHFLKQIGYLATGTVAGNDLHDDSNTLITIINDTLLNGTTTLINENNQTSGFFGLNGGGGGEWLEQLKNDKFDHWAYFVCWSAVGSYTIYFSVGGFLHWYFYVRQRDRPHEWKCQPEKWLSPELELHEIMIGCLSLVFCSILTGTIACYAFNDGSLSKIYYQFNEYSWWWLIVQGPLVFIYQDYATYLLHRMYHIPFLYRNFHKLHHKYKQPTAFSVVAIHPVEILHIQITLAMPIFIVPFHWIPFYAVVLYTYYHAILDHSGITFKAQWWQPWQPDAIFHDNHHQYTHVNFGFNIYLWDKLHDTYRRKDRVYTEDIFYGKGKALDEVSENVLLNDIAERKSENPLAYRNNININVLSKNDLKTKKSAIAATATKKKNH